MSFRKVSFGLFLSLVVFHGSARSQIVDDDRCQSVLKTIVEIADAFFATGGRSVDELKNTILAQREKLVCDEAQTIKLPSGTTFSYGWRRDDLQYHLYHRGMVFVFWIKNGDYFVSEATGDFRTSTDLIVRAEK